MTTAPPSSTSPARSAALEVPRRTHGRSVGRASTTAAYDPGLRVLR